MYFILTTLHIIAYNTHMPIGMHFTILFTSTVYSLLGGALVSPRVHFTLAEPRPSPPPKPTPVFPMSPLLHFIYPKYIGLLCKFSGTYYDGLEISRLSDCNFLLLEGRGWAVSRRHHSRNRQPVSGASAPRPFFCPPAPLSNNYSTHRYSPFNQHFICLYVIR